MATLFKAMMVIGVVGLVLSPLGIKFLLKKKPADNLQWEVKATKYKEVLPAGWEPFAYDKTSNLLILKRIKTEKVEGGDAP